MKTNLLGRVGVIFVVLLSVAVPLALVIHGQASAYMESQAARTAVAAALRALPAAQPVATMSLAGPAASDGERAELLKIVEAYEELRAGGQYAQAWELFHPETYGEWDAETWMGNQEEDAGHEVEDALGAVTLFSKDRKLVDVLIQGDTGVAELALQMAWPQGFVFRRDGGEWAIDLQRTDQAVATLSVGSQLSALSAQAEGGLLSLLMLSEVGGTLEALLDPDRVVASDPVREVTGAVVSGDTAQISMVRRGTVRVAAPLKCTGGSWSVAWDQPFTLLRPGMVLRDALNPDEAPEPSLDPDASACQFNLQQLATAAMMYCQDYDEKFPIADRWCDATFPYVKTDSIYACPADDGEYSYAMNYKLSRTLIGKVDSPSETILLFESEPSLKNAWDGKGNLPGSTLAEPPRHDGYNNFAWTDGHVTRSLNDDVGLNEYRLTKQAYE